MTKISWNDINDADSQLESDFDQTEEQILKAPQKLATQSTEDNKLKHPCINEPNLGDKLSLEKLASHGKSEVWLFVPNSFYEHADRVNDILEQSQLILKVNRIKGIGWNLYASYENARKLLADGLIKDNHIIRFIYSNKNEQQSEKKSTFVDKNNKQAYIEKRVSATEENCEAIKMQEKAQTIKAKVKWVEKDKKLQDVDDKKIIREELRSPRDYKKTKDFKSPKKYVEKKPTSQHPQSVYTQKVVEKKQEQTNDVKKNITRGESIQEQEKIEKKVDQEYSDSSEQVPMEKKKYPHRKNKNKTGKTGRKDANNPFSFFAS